jgi:hypothetical protein
VVLRGKLIIEFKAEIKEHGLLGIHDLKELIIKHQIDYEYESLRCSEEADIDLEEYDLDGEHYGIEEVCVDFDAKESRIIWDA